MDYSKGKDRTRKTYSIFASFIICCLGTSLMIASLATQYWFQSGCKSGQKYTSQSDVHFGLFSGTNSLIDVAYLGYNTKIVCSDGDCMFSCGRNSELRRQQLEAVRNGLESEYPITENCDRLKGSDATLLSLRRMSELLDGTRIVPAALISSLRSNQDTGRNESVKIDEEEVKSQEHVIGNQAVLLADESSSSSAVTSTFTSTEGSTPSTKAPPHDPVFMSYGLWVGTISCLVIGMLFAVVGALFAVINTATTPVEFITGVPGLYIWNSMAALFNMICVILWAVQFHKYLTKNVLLYDADSGWTTEGLESFGYSFWLVVAAIFVHVGNIVIIFVGTYERKVKEQLEKPQEKSVNLMLY